MIRGILICLFMSLLATARAQQPASTRAAPPDLPTTASITEVLQRVHGYLDRATPMRVINRTSQQPITDLTNPVADAVLDRGEENAFEIVSYPSGVTYSGMLLASEVTGDARYADFTAKRLQFLHDVLPYFRSQSEKFRLDRGPLRAITNTSSLDDSGAMCAALIKARRARIGPDLQPLIDHWADYVHARQFRLDDGTLARHRPQPQSVWADDMYMSIPALAQMGKLTGETKYYDDAAKQMLGFARHLFNNTRGIYTHGCNLNQPENPEFYWARANGWAMMANVELLEVLPEDHPQRQQILQLLRAHIRSVSPMQSGNGLWHQMLDKTDTYSETSASAMFVYGIARAVNRGWIGPVAYGPVAIAGWKGVATRVNDKGQVEGTCVATTFASDNAYYYNRRTSVFAAHGYGPVMLAGAEMLRLLQNPAWDIRYNNGATHFVPRPP